jgi:hypothetical protein
MSSLNQDNISNTRLIAGLFFTFVVFIFLKFMSAAYESKNLLHWWRTNNGAKYNKQLDLFAIVLSFKAKWLYYPYSFFMNSVHQDLSAERLRFIYNRIVNFRTRPEAKPDMYNFMLPRNLCESILRSEDDQDPVFNSWLSANQLTTTKHRLYDGNGNPTGDSPRGLYPSPLDAAGWRGKFNEWGVIFFEEDGIHRVDSSKTDLLENKAKWDDVETHRDNIFRLYRINKKSEVILSLVNDAYNDKEVGQQFKQIASRHLIGYNYSQTQAGGWLGFVKGTTDDSDSIESIYSLQYEGDTSPEENKNQQDKSCGAMDYTTAGISGGVTAASIGVFMAMGPETAGLSWAMLALIGGIGIASGAESILSNPCKKPWD